MACDFQQCGILTSLDSDEPVQPPFLSVETPNDVHQYLKAHRIFMRLAKALIRLRTSDIYLISLVFHFICELNRCHPLKKNQYTTSNVYLQHMLLKINAFFTISFS